jgi:hypothetical protein
MVDLVSLVRLRAAAAQLRTNKVPCRAGAFRSSVSAARNWRAGLGTTLDRPSRPGSFSVLVSSRLLNESFACACAIGQELRKITRFAYGSFREFKD